MSHRHLLICNLLLLHLLGSVILNRGGATVLKVGEKTLFASEASGKIFFCTPHIWKSGGTIFLHVGGTSKEITIIIEYTEICCLVVALIHIS